MGLKRVRVRRERPTALALAVALCLTMLVVYVMTLDAKSPRGRVSEAASLADAPRVTREIALEPLSGWCVSMAACASPREARLQASAWAGRGAAGCVRQLEGAWRVLGALYDSRKEAERIVRRLNDEDGIPAEALPLEAEGLTLRVTAPGDQIDAVAGADALLRAQTRRLGETALQLDRGEISPDAARALTALAATEASRMAERLAAIPGAGENGLSAGLLKGLEALARMQADLAHSAPGDATSLSGLLRCAQIECFLDHRALLRQ